MRRALAALILLLAAPVHAADSEGAPGRILALTRNAPSSDEYPISHGSVLLKPKQGDEQRYYWGGSRCPGKNLSDTEVATLERAFLARKPWLRPFYKNGQGGAICLVGFTVSHQP